jgi:DNA-directed RNA polymerase specialized sigma24 family protein
VIAPGGDGGPVTVGEVQVGSFAAFADGVTPRLKAALVAALGVERAADAAGEALAYAWEHWERVRIMENPAGYLYRVGVSRGRRWRPLPTVFPPPPNGDMPWVEPGLPKALGGLSERQRVAVVLVHCLDWTQDEVAGLLGISRGSAPRDTTSPRFPSPTPPTRFCATEIWPRWSTR